MQGIDLVFAILDLAGNRNRKLNDSGHGVKLKHKHQIMTLCNEWLVLLCQMQSTAYQTIKILTTMYDNEYKCRK